MKYNPLEVRCAHLAEPVRGRFSDPKPIYCAFERDCNMKYHSAGRMTVCKAELDPLTYKRPKNHGKA